MHKFDDLPDEVCPDMTHEPQHEEVTEEEKRQYNESEEKKRRWDEEEDEERRRDQTDNVVMTLGQSNTDRQKFNLSHRLVNESYLTPDLYPPDIKKIIARLRIIVDHIDSPSKQAQELIHELARLLDEKGQCERYNISKKIKEILKDKIRTGKVTGRWIESCLPSEYKRMYVKSELSSLSSSKRKQPDSASMEPALVPPIQIRESGHSHPRESDDTNSGNHTVTKHEEANQSEFDDNSEEGTAKVESREEPTIKQNRNFTYKRFLVSKISMPFEDLQKDMEVVFRITKGIGDIFFKVSFDLERYVAEIEFCGFTKQRGIDMMSKGTGRITKEARFLE